MTTTHRKQRTSHHIVVLGAGYTGMFAAIRLAHRTRRTGTRVTLVNPSARFTERLRLHQTATGQHLADHRIPDLLTGTGVTFVQGTATALDPEAHTLVLDRGAATLSYDTLVVALGSATDTGPVPGAAQHAYTLNGREAAGRLAARLDGAGSVAVCGSGLTGVETATEIAESHPGLRVTLVGAEEPGALMGDRARAHLRRALDRLGVEVRAGARVAKVLPDAVELAGGETLTAEVCVWTAGVRVPALAAEAGLTVDERGRIVTDPTLRSVSHPSVYAIGDCAAVRMPWGLLHGTCGSGMPTAQYAADALARRLRGKEPGPFRYGYVHQAVSLGRRDAVIQFTHPDDRPRRACLTGRAAVRYKELVSSSPVPFYRLSRRMNVSATLSRAGRAS
ncbi:FAD-dependent oxidoreductase [Streptomyces sp. NPDC005820]|uniref:NAD(P)/FAD-dependent oxidoreductase n=1 Tax=Streptomyces sp. NPDC005820 TaxID=3157069 RepID=UPI0033D0BFF4